MSGRDGTRETSMDPLASMVAGLVGLLLAPVRGPRAYLDPGSGSYLLQLLIAGLFGALFVVKLSWGKIKAFFGRLFSRHGDRPDDHS
jgi:hypothetical protein